MKGQGLAAESESGAAYCSFQTPCTRKNSDSTRLAGIRQLQLMNGIMMSTERGSMVGDKSQAECDLTITP
jgi:hypothetical protein